MAKNDKLYVPKQGLSFLIVNLFMPILVHTNLSKMANEKNLVLQPEMPIRLIDPLYS